MEPDGRMELIRALIPLGLMAVYEELDREVEELAGRRHGRKPEGDRLYRHGTNRGSVKLAGRRVPIKAPRVRGPHGEVRLDSYDALHRGGDLDETPCSAVFCAGCRAATTSGRRRIFPGPSVFRVLLCSAGLWRRALGVFAS